MASAETTAETLVLIRAHAQARADLVAMTRLLAQAEVRSFTGWYDHAAITLMAARLAKLTRASQKQTAASTDGFSNRLLRLLTGKRVPLLGPIPVADLRGVPLEAVYGRLADQHRFLTATRGPDAPASLLDRPESPQLPPLPRLTPDEVTERVVERVEVQVDDNLSLAFRDQWAAEMEAAPVAVTGYRRIIHPELTATGSQSPGPVCGLCLVVSDRIYNRGTLLALHARCRCSVAPIVGDPGGDGDPGAEINGADLGRIYKEAGGTASRTLKNTRVRIVENSETGPRLTFAIDRHRTNVPAKAPPKAKKKKKAKADRDDNTTTPGAAT